MVVVYVSRFIDMEYTYLYLRNNAQKLLSYQCSAVKQIIKNTLITLEKMVVSLLMNLSSYT